MSKRIRIFTHIDLDGYGCALLAKLAVGKDNIKADYCGYTNINEKVKSFIDKKEYESYDYILITDISVNEEVAELINSLDCRNKFILLDHHETALFLNKYDWATVMIQDASNVYTCGTDLTYCKLLELGLLQYKSAINELVLNITRYDTWTWKTIYNDIQPKKLNDLFKIYGPQRFCDVYIDRIQNLKGDFELFNETDKFLLNLEEEKINTFIYKKLKSVHVEDITINNKTYKVGIVFAAEHISELGNTICEKKPELDFAAIVADMHTVSYRSIKTDIDLGGNVAKHYGGGGRPQTAGSQISKELQQQIINMIFK